jgi:hypothetical protein
MSGRVTQIASFACVAGYPPSGEASPAKLAPQSTIMVPDDSNIYHNYVYVIS